MKKLFGLTIAMAALAANPAFALKVTNLDGVSHTVLFDSAGTKQSIVLVPNSSYYFTSSPAGQLSLVTTPKPSKSSAVQAQGILRNYMGNGRNQAVPADPDDQFVIWSGGDLVLQRHIRQQGIH